MTKTVLYKYLGTNGTIVSPVHLEDVYYIRQYKLTAKAGKQLTKDFYNYRTRRYRFRRRSACLLRAA